MLSCFGIIGFNVAKWVRGWPHNPVFFCYTGYISGVGEDTFAETHIILAIFIRLSKTSRIVSCHLSICLSVNFVSAPYLENG